MRLCSRNSRIFFFSRCFFLFFFSFSFLKSEKTLIKSLIDLPTEPTMELMSSLIAMRASLKLPDVYDPLQIILQETGSQEIKLLMMQSAVNSVFIMNDSHLLPVLGSTYHPSQLVCHGSQFHLQHLGSAMMHQY